MLLFFTLHAHIQTNILLPISHKAKWYWQHWHEYTLSQLHTTQTRHWYVHRHNSWTDVMWLFEVQRRMFICFKWRLDLRQTDHEQDLVCIFLRWSPRWHDVETSTGGGNERPWMFLMHYGWNGAKNYYLLIKFFYLQAYCR